MILIFTGSSSDWKYRASQRTEILAVGSKKELVERRNKEIRGVLKVSRGVVERFLRLP